MSTEIPMGELVQVMWPEPPEAENGFDADVHYLRPEYRLNNIQRSTGGTAMAKVIDFPRRSSLGLVRSEDADVHYIDARIAPPSQEGIETTEDVLTYMRDMYDYYGIQNYGYEQTDRDNESVEQTALQARQDAHQIAKQLLGAQETEHALQALDIFGKGELYSRRLKSCLVGCYADRGLISDSEAVSHWKELLASEQPAIVAQVKKDYSKYIAHIESDETYGATELAKRRIQRLESQMGVTHNLGDTPGPHGA